MQPKVRIKKGDSVKVLTGKDKGKTGKVVHVNHNREMVTVEGVNVLTRFERPRKAGQKGQKVQFPAPLRVGKVSLVCPACGKPTRVGFETDEKGAKKRVCKKCNKRIE